MRPTGLTRLAPPLVALTLAAGAQAACGADPEPAPVAAVAISPSAPPLTAGTAPSKPHLGLPFGLFATPAPPPDPSHHPRPIQPARTATTPRTRSARAAIRPPGAVSLCWA